MSYESVIKYGRIVQIIAAALLVSSAVEASGQIMNPDTDPEFRKYLISNMAKKCKANPADYTSIFKPDTRRELQGPRLATWCQCFATIYTKELGSKEVNTEITETSRSTREMEERLKVKNEQMRTLRQQVIPKVATYCYQSTMRQQ